MYLPELTFTRLYDEFVSLLSWHWQNEISQPERIVLNNPLNLPLVSLYNPIHPSLITIVNAHSLPYCLAQPSTLENTQVIIFADNSDEMLENKIVLFEQLRSQILSTPADAISCLTALSPFAVQHLSPQVTLHGTFISVLGQGILLTGESGVGKSLAALYCIKQNYALVADDAPYFFRDSRQIFGSCPANIRGLLEVRHLGILDIPKTYGPHFIRNKYPLNLIVCLTSLASQKRIIDWQPSAENILGIPIPKIELPFTENIALLIENAARCLYTNQILKS